MPDNSIPTRPTSLGEWIVWVRNQNIPDGPKNLLYALVSHADWKTGDDCYPEQETLADDCRCTVRAIQERLKVLRNANLIQIQGRKTRKGNRGNLYVLAPSLILDSDTNAASPEEESEAKPDSGGRQADTKIAAGDTKISVSDAKPASPDLDTEDPVLSDPESPIGLDARACARGEQKENGEEEEENEAGLDDLPSRSHGPEGDRPEDPQPIHLAPGDTKPASPGEADPRMAEVLAAALTYKVIDTVPTDGDEAGELAWALVQTAERCWSEKIRDPATLAVLEAMHPSFDGVNPLWPEPEAVAV